MRRITNRALKLNHVEEPQVNLTPLIDVVFVILIMFILVAPILELDKVELADGGSNQDSIAVQEHSPIAIYVHGDNRITFNERFVIAEQLPDLLRQAKQRYPNAKLQLFHDRRGQFGVYQSIKNAAETAGFNQIDIVLRP